MQFPHLDPIPIPAPVWLMKALSLLTLSLHFFAVQILIGSLVAVIGFNILGRQKQDSRYLSSAAVAARRLPIVMTYVINLGVPPLLFAQVLYGPALYTSSVLIAGMWISVIFLVMACYWLLYKISDGAAQGKPVGLMAIGALLLAGGVGQIYSLNMTLMLKPEVWSAMYAKTATGIQTPPHDPTMMPRWLLMMLGGLIGGGLWLTVHSLSSTVKPETQGLLRRTGAAMAVVGGLLQIFVSFWIKATQPVQVIDELAKSPFYTAGFWLLIGGSVLVLALSALNATAKTTNPILTWLAPVVAFLGIAGYVIFRDGIRDVTLFQKGFNVWNRTEASNWSVIAIFLLLFVAGLGTVGWLLSVMGKAKTFSEEVKL